MVLFWLVIVSNVESAGQGKRFSHEYFNVQPDMILSAKAIGGGLPLGALMVTELLGSEFSPGEHGTTFGGNPVSCAAGNVVLTEVFENHLVDEVKKNGTYFMEQLNELKNIYPDDIKEVRGRGFMIGVDFKYECTDIVAKLRERKILANCTNNTVLRILPPLNCRKN